MKNRLDLLANGSAYGALIHFLCNHPPLQDDEEFDLPEKGVDEGYSAAICAAFPNPDERILSIGEVTSHKVMVLGLELVLFERQLVQDYDEKGECISVGFTSYPVPVVRLPDGKLFEVRNGDDLAKLRTMLKSSFHPGEVPPQQAEKPSQPPE